MQFFTRYKNFLTQFLSIILVFLFLATIFSFLNQSAYQTPKTISLNQLAKDIQENKIKKIDVIANEIQVEYLDGKKAITRKENNTSIIETLLNYGVDKNKIADLEINVEKEKESVWNILLPLLSILAPLIFFFWFFGMINKQAKTNFSETFDFLKSPARVFEKEKGEKITFNDIAGLKEAKQELIEIIDFLKNPKKYLQIGARIPRGVLLVGPPGTGKTMLAKAVANESNVPFFSISGSEFVELFVGVGAGRVRNLFLQARKAGKAIIFIDEIDTIGKVRGVGITGGHEEREQTLNQLLAEMDGIGREEGIIVMGATNRPEYLDPALLRPGRFDRRIVLDLPDVNDREEILKIHCRQKPLGKNVNLKEIAERTPGFSGADLANLVNEAALLAARRNKTVIEQEDLIEAIEKVILGPERKSHILSKKEKEIAAYHETGHALVTTFLPNAEEVRKISIISRGMAAGYTISLPREEKNIKQKSELLAEISVLLGGYCAEKIKYNEISTGAGNDLERATVLAKDLVTKYGMSKLGPITFGKRVSFGFLGYEEEVEKNYSEKTATLIDQEVKRIIKECSDKATKILLSHKALFEKVAQTLIEKETIEKEEFEKLVGQEKT
jgi:cell division protease FtsH